MAEPAAQPCLADTVVALFVDGGLDPGARPGVEQHLDGCAACRALVAAVARQGGVPAAESGAFATRDERAGRARPPRDAEVQPDQRIGRYLIVQAVGRGAMGTVYLARDQSLDRRVAIKVLRSSALDRDAHVRLLREAQAMARIDHANVVAVHDIGEHAGQVFLALEYVGGGNLRKWLAVRRSWREVATVFLAAARGLAAVHDAGMVHRDFKPDNVLIAEDGSVHVGDFGLVSAATAGPAAPPSLTTSDLEVSLTATGVVVGTPAYMAPEQFLGEIVDARSDQFAFSAALFEALYGVRPFAGDDVQALSTAVLSGTCRVVPRGDVPRGLSTLVMRGLARRPGDRHPSMHDVIAVLDRLVGGGRRRRGWVLAGAAGGMIAAAAVAVVVATRGGAAPAATCSGSERELATIWNDARRAAAAEQFTRAGVAYAADTSTRVGHELDAYAADWIRSHRDTCEATHVRHTQDERVMAARMSCLGDRKARLRAVIEQLVTPRTGAASIEAVTSAPRMVGALPTVASCDALTEPEIARLAPAARWQQIAPVEDELRQLEVVASVAPGGAVIAEARTMVATADATGFAPLRARARKLLGSLMIAMSQDDAVIEEAYQVLAVAAQLADEGRDDPTRVEVLRLLAIAAVSRLDRVAGRAHLDTWRGALVRTGGDPDTDVWYLATRGMLEVFEGKIADSEADAARIDRVIAADHGGFAERAEWVTFFATAATEYAAPAAQLAHTEQLLATARTELGPLHPQTVAIESLVGIALYYLHRYDEGEAILRAVVAHATDPSYENGDERVALGAIARETGRYVEAEAWFAADEAADPDGDPAELDYQRGLLAYEQGQLPRALELYRRAQTEMRTWLPDGHPFTAQLWSAIAAAERRRGRFTDALAAAKEAQRVVTGQDADTHRRAEALAEVGLAAAALGQRADAIEALDGAIAASDRGSILPYHLAEARVALARLVAATEPDRARALAEAAAAAVTGARTKWARRVATEAAALVARLRRA